MTACRFSIGFWALKIVVAPNALKGSLSARAAAEAIAAGVAVGVPHARVVRVPIADGGDGLLEVLQDALPMRRVSMRVRGPLGAEVEAGYLSSDDGKTAIIEMAAAAGLVLLESDRLDPLAASTFGVGQLMLDAVRRGAETLLVGIGGSATNDGGMGMACALGIVFLDAHGRSLAGNGRNLEAICRIDMSSLAEALRGVTIKVICDVDNPLLGPNGATRVFGAQKGVDRQAGERLETGLRNLAEVIRRDLGSDVYNLPGAGAAGGLGAGLVAFLGAELLPGADLVLDMLGFDQALEDADLLLTAEGRLDAQTLSGKAPAVVALRAKAAGVPCIAIAGCVDVGPAGKAGFDAAFSLCPGPLGLDDAMRNAAAYLRVTAANIASCFSAGLRRYDRGMGMSSEQVIKKCIFPAAGYGTRFLPATKAMPKEMLPVVDKPLIQYGVEEAVAAGMTDIGIITGRGKRSVEDHFDISYELEHQISGTKKEEQLSDIRRIIEECTFSYTRQIEMLGLGHAILTAETLVGDAPFGVILADDLCINAHRNVMRQLVDVYAKYRCSVVAIEEVDAEEVDRYGVIDGQEIEDGVFKVNGMVEKPDKDKTPSNLAIIGRYILTPEIFDIIRATPPGKHGELQITDALRIQAERNMVLACRFDGRRFDCGSVHGFVEATNYFYQAYRAGKDA